MDILGQWFDEFKKRNECIDGIIGFYSPDKKLETRLYPHSYYDAISVLLSHIHETGTDIPASQLPLSLGRAEPNSFKKLYSFLLYLVETTFRPIPRKLKTIQNGWPENKIPVNFERFAWRILDNDNSARVLSKARSVNANINSYTLCKLLPHLEPFWKDKISDICVGVPVSLYNKIEPGNKSGNRFSVIDLWINEQTTPEEVKLDISNKIKKNKHYATWIGYHLPKFLGKWFFHYYMLVADLLQRKNIIYSNLGNWPMKDESSIFLIPPVFHHCPISVGIITWGGKLSLSIQIHPHVVINKEQIEDLLDSWITDIIENTKTDYWANSRKTADPNFRVMHT